ncbi:hypothetical protein [Clostridium hydrogenum]|uniref:hypothetical protein n=1 Tax=Clostridium hydrogenum TaxID=2855764 RepID=UPI001F23F3C1|nr:hypothetical protein [Clostridium hydrogenum]
MSTVSSTTNSSSLYNVQANSQVQDAQRVHHHHHHKNQSQDSDSIQLSNQTSQVSSTDPTSKTPGILDSLVANGTISQDQETAIQSAFEAARQANSISSGAYGSSGSKPTNPISGLVANGTISQNQADSIQSAFKASHHHHVAQTQDTVQAVDGSTQDETDSLIQALNSLSQSSDTSSSDADDTLLQSLEDLPQIDANNY